MIKYYQSNFGHVIGVCEQGLIEFNEIKTMLPSPHRSINNGEVVVAPKNKEEIKLEPTKIKNGMCHLCNERKATVQGKCNRCYNRERYISKKHPKEEVIYNYECVDCRHEFKSILPFGKVKCQKDQSHLVVSKGEQIIKKNSLQDFKDN